MGKIREDFKFKKINNFFDENELKILSMYCDMKSRISMKNFRDPAWHQGFYGDPIMDCMLLHKKDIVKKETNLELLPTYSFWRLYTKFQYLPKHKDRPQCEISLTACIMNDGTEWPIFIDGNPIVLNPGDACIYLGCESFHWREEFKGDNNTQVFFHYVDKNGPNSDEYMDKRYFWGTDKGK